MKVFNIMCVLIHKFPVIDQGSTTFNYEGHNIFFFIDVGLGKVCRVTENVFLLAVLSANSVFLLITEVFGGRG